MLVIAVEHAIAECRLYNEHSSFILFSVILSNCSLRTSSTCDAGNEHKAVLVPA